MKFTGIEKDIEKYLETFKPQKENDLSGTLHAQFTNEYDKAVILALRTNHVNMSKFLQMALWEWEYILNKMVAILPAYIKENLNGYENNENKGE